MFGVVQVLWVRVSKSVSCKCAQRVIAWNDVDVELCPGVLEVGVVEAEWFEQVLEGFFDFARNGEEVFLFGGRKREQVIGGLSFQDEVASSEVALGIVQVGVPVVGGEEFELFRSHRGAVGLVLFLVRCVLRWLLFPQRIQGVLAG